LSEILTDLDLVLTDPTGAVVLTRYPDFVIMPRT